MCLPEDWPALQQAIPGLGIQFGRTKSIGSLEVQSLSCLTVCLTLILGSLTFYALIG